MGKMKVFEKVGGRMRKAIALLFIFAGLLMIGLTSYEMIQGKNAQNEALEEAKLIISGDDKPKGSAINNDEPQEMREGFRAATGDIIGVLSIPRLEVELPIIEGTHEDELAIGVGHYSKTAFPTDGKQILLSGHRDTVFRQLGQLEIGDVFEVEMEYGTFVYLIAETFIVDADDTTVIDYSIDEEVLTVSTCYPFNFIGSAPERYIINAKPADQ